MFFNKSLQQKLDTQEVLITELYGRISELEIKLYKEIEKNRASIPYGPIKKEVQPSPTKLVDRRQVITNPNHSPLINRTTEPSYPSCSDMVVQSAIIASSYSSNDDYSSSCSSSSSDYSSSCSDSYSSSDY